VRLSIKRVIRSMFLITVYTSNSQWNGKNFVLSRARVTAKCTGGMLTVSLTFFDGFVM